MRALLQKHGDFKQVELKLARWEQKKHTDNLGGRWVTKRYLEEVCMYTATMIKNSFEYAKAQGLHRINPVHKEEEAKLVLEESFSQQCERGENRTLECGGTLEAGLGLETVYLEQPG